MFMRANETMLPYRGYTALKPMFASVVGKGIRVASTPMYV